jgi:hypothetical protein
MKQRQLFEFSSVYLFWKKGNDGGAKDMGYDRHLKITNPAHASLYRRNNAAGNVPTDQLAANGKMHLRLGYLNNRVKINRLKNTQVLPYAVSRIAGCRSRLTAQTPVRQV